MLLRSVSESVPAPCIIKAESLTVASLDDSQKGEVLAFLSERPACTFIMAGLIRDNGLESPLNRGAFYGCRGAAGRLEGVTLIGENTLLEAHTEAALEALARRTQSAPDVHMVIGEQALVRGFWRHYADEGRAMRRLCRELLFELRYPVGFHQPLPGLRPATLDELEELMAVHAEMALEESGVNPLETDPQGFERRCARRIELGRTWVYTENGRLVFKADVIAETPEVAYLEGVYVSSEARGQGHGVRCLSQLSRHLLSRSKSTCVLVNERNLAAHALYRKAGYQLRGLYDTIFLHQGRGGGAHPC